MIFRLLFFIFVYLPFMLIFCPIQYFWAKLKLPYWHLIPRAFHILGAIFIGLRVTVIGKPVEGKPVLIVSNHISWTDIIAVGSKANVTYVAKKEIEKWFFVNFMAGLQRTLFVDRNRRHDAKRTTGEMAQRMADGHAVLLFAEGQSDIGTHVLPFRSALVGAAQQAMVGADSVEVLIQPLTISYTRLQGLPVSRNERSLIAWIKSKSFKQNVSEILTGGIKDVTLAFGVPKPLTAGADRKQVTREAEADVRRMLVALNRGTTLPAVK